MTDVLVDNSVKWDENFRQYQFERNGYFAVDPDSTPSKVIWMIFKEYYLHKAKIHTLCNFRKVVYHFKMFSSIFYCAIRGQIASNLEN